MKPLEILVFDAIALAVMLISKAFLRPGSYRILFIALVIGAATDTFNWLAYLVKAGEMNQNVKSFIVALIPIKMIAEPFGLLLAIVALLRYANECGWKGKWEK